MYAQDLMSSPVFTCHVNDPLNVAAQRMWQHDCGALAIVNEEGSLTGMITDRDICMAAYTQGRAIDSILVNTAMAHHVVSARPEQPIVEIEQLMAEHQLRRIPIIDAAGHPIGIISINDISREIVRPDSRMKQRVSKIAHTIAAISKRHPSRKAA